MCAALEYRLSAAAGSMPAAHDEIMQHLEELGVGTSCLTFPYPGTCWAENFIITQSCLPSRVGSLNLSSLASKQQEKHCNRGYNGGLRNK